MNKRRVFYEFSELLPLEDFSAVAEAEDWGIKVSDYIEVEESLIGDLRKMYEDNDYEESQELIDLARDTIFVDVDKLKCLTSQAYSRNSKEVLSSLNSEKGGMGRG